MSLNKTNIDKDQLRATTRRIAKRKKFVMLFTALTVFVLIFTGLVNSSYSQTQTKNLTQSSLQKTWETPSIFKSPESAFYSSEDDVLYVSNIDGPPDKQDQQGFISKVSPENGTIQQLNWLEGLNAPKGISSPGNNILLYVADITQLVAINTTDAKIIKKYQAPNSIFLNDVTYDNQGNIYVSDTMGNTIYILDKNQISAAGDPSNNESKNNLLKVWMHDPELNGPNGLIVDNDKGKLIVASMGSIANTSSIGTIQTVDLINKTISNLGVEEKTVPYGNLDGIVSDSTGKYYYVTDWKAGKLFIVNSNGTGYNTLIDLNTNGTADLDYIPDGNMLAVPIMTDNKLISYKIAN